LDIDGHKSKDYSDAPSDYSGRVLTHEAIRFVDTSTSEHQDQPFFLYYAPVAPHASSACGEVQLCTPVPDPRDTGRFSGIPPWRPPSYGKEDHVADKPAYIRKRAWDAAITKTVDTFRERQLEALRGVDRNIHELLSHLPSNTLIVFMSDNGFLWGEHRYAGKVVPYEESIRIPLVIRWAGSIPEGTTDPRLALNVDLAPAFLEAAGLDPTTPTGIDPSGDVRAPEGESLWSSVMRDDFVVEHADGHSGVPAYCGVRTAEG
jgi:arylsulfatase A-like enzyme